MRSSSVSCDSRSNGSAQLKLILSMDGSSVAARRPSRKYSRRRAVNRDGYNDLRRWPLHVIARSEATKQPRGRRLAAPGLLRFARNGGLMRLAPVDDGFGLDLDLVFP